MWRKRNQNCSCDCNSHGAECVQSAQCLESILPLSAQQRTGRIKICRVTGNRELCGRMAAMGVYPGVVADIICSGKNSHCILKVNGGTVSLNSDLSQNILVAHIN